MPHTPEELIEEFETKGEGRVRFMWTRQEARDWLLSAFTRLQAESYEQAAKICEGMAEKSDNLAIAEPNEFEYALTQAAEEIRKAKE